MKIIVKDETAKTVWINKVITAIDNCQRIVQALRIEKQTEQDLYKSLSWWRKIFFWSKYDGAFSKWEMSLSWKEGYLISLRGIRDELMLVCKGQEVELSFDDTYLIERFQ